MSIDPKIDADSKDDEAWLLFLKKFENLKLPPTPKTHKHIEEKVIDGIFNKSIRPLRKPT
jgi:hypothetical protein